MEDSQSRDEYVERLLVLARLPLLLNSSLDSRRVIETALKHLQALLKAEAATIFSVERGIREISFWALQGSEQRLLNQKIPFGKGIVGWVIEKKLPVHVKDVRADERFFSKVDEESSFKTREVMCVPLIARGDQVLGALQVLNPISSEHFEDEDLSFLEQYAQQLALALENARLYTTLQEQHLKLEALERRKSEVVSVISHEFRTPLNIIRTSAELLIAEAPEGLQTLSDALLNGVDRLTRVVSQIINLSLVQPESIRTDRQIFSANSLAEAAVGKFLDIAKGREISLSYKAPAEELRIRADQSLLFIALSNLIANAIRFTPNAGSITVSCVSKTGMVEFSVADMGIGIAETEKALIFEKFYEVTPAEYHSSGDYTFKSCGLGLGLPTTASILEAHGSKIHVESCVDQGSVFSFLIPQA